VFCCSECSSYYRYYAVCHYGEVVILIVIVVSFTLCTLAVNIIYAECDVFIVMLSVSIVSVTYAKCFLLCSVSLGQVLLHPSINLAFSAGLKSKFLLLILNKYCRLLTGYPLLVWTRQFLNRFSDAPLLRMIS
jgi:hypothetical protein